MNVGGLILKLDVEHVLDVGLQLNECSDGPLLPIKLCRGFDGFLALVLDFPDRLL